MVFLAALLCLGSTFGVVQIRFALRRRRLNRRSWEEIFERLEPVDVAAVREIAERYLDPAASQLRLEPWQMWQALGGSEGLERLRQNAAAMLDLAVYCSHWNAHEAPILTEMIRRDAVRFNQAANRLQLAVYFRLGCVWMPFQMQEAAAAYYLMRGRLLSLYRETHGGLYPRLVPAV